jgi:glycosyltransferase involved in cell wall biosynthesis
VKISVLVCAHDEEARIAACLTALSGFDEVVVVADRCSDATAAVARRSGARVIEGVFPLESLRKEAGIAACSGEWILEIDCDERVTPELTAEIRAAVAAAQGDWFKIPIDNYVGDVLVRFGWGGSFGTTLGGRLARRGVKRWKADRVHPGVVFDGELAGVLTSPLEHYVDDDLSDMVMRLNRYTTLRASDLADRGEPGGLGENVFRGFRRFWKCYVGRKGRRDGDLGFMISLMAALYPVISHLKAKEILRLRAVAPKSAAAAAARAA